MIVFVLSIGDWAWEHPFQFFYILILLGINIWGMNRIYPIERAFSTFIKEDKNK